jgi:PIN like domain
MSPALAKAIGILEGASTRHSVVHLREKFSVETKDDVWIRQLGEEGNWVIVSGDPRITKNPHNRKAWLASGLTAFFLKSGWTNLKLWVIAAKLVEWWPRIVAQAEMITSGEGFLVPVRGSKFEKLERRY